jgi:hypothetical protein
MINHLADIFVASAVLGAVSLHGGLMAADAPRADNGFITEGYLYNSDPTCHTIGDRFWIFVSHDQVTEQFRVGDYNSMFDYHALSTTDFATWVDHGSIINRHDAKWIPTHSGMKALWDGDAGIEVGGKFYGYFPFGDAIGAFVADRPEGPYKDALGKPLIARDTPGITPYKNDQSLLVSPSVFFDSKGEAYLYFGQYELYVARLKKNMIELAENPVRCKIPADYFEGPMIVPINGRYYFSYANGYGGRGVIRYCVSDNPYGPFADPRDLVAAWPRQYSTHHGIGQYKGQWYLAYHMECSSYHRRTRVTPLDVRADGSLGLIDPQSDRGVPTDKSHRLLLDAFVWKREAEEFHDRRNADPARGVWQDYHMCLRDGGYLRFNDMDFGKGAAGLRVEVSCTDPAARERRLEFRLDAPDGPVAGRCDIRHTGGKSVDYVTLTGAVSGAVGVHDIYLVAVAGADKTDKELFAVNWFTFTPPVAGGSSQRAGSSQSEDKKP